MSAATTISVTLSPDLLLRAQTIAENEHRTVSDLVADALRRYVIRDPEWEAMLEASRRQAQEMGVTSEADVDRIIHEHRLSKRA